jgi:hypothetical protein
MRDSKLRQEALMRGVPPIARRTLAKIYFVVLLDGRRHPVYYALLSEVAQMVTQCLDQVSVEAILRW